jgi:hypothetical protein
MVGPDALLVALGEHSVRDLAGALLAQRAQVHGGLGPVGPPRLRDVGQRAAGAVPFGDLGVQPAFVAGQRVGGVRAADHDQLGGERSLLTKLGVTTAEPAEPSRS